MLVTKSAWLRRAMMRCLLLTGIASLSGPAFSAPAAQIASGGEMFPKLARFGI